MCSTAGIFRSRDDEYLSVMRAGQPPDAREPGPAPGVEVVVLPRRPAAEDSAAAFAGLPVEVDDDLVECDFGEWEG